ncbi:MAG TPA: phytanoyl-CoA dioxygenase family protein [Myxococcota bacterium]|nr:phytanoyl-CoA dioxygenase family protein [Myxococcota bacterium]
MPEGVPKPTGDLAQAEKDLRDYGVCLLEGALPGAQLERVRNALYRAADDDRTRGREAKFNFDYAHDDSNQRVWNLLSRDPVFADLVEHPAALQLLKTFIGWPLLLSNISANITGPGGGEMVLHADQIYMPQPWSGIQALNVGWCIDRFADENGATRIVPFSHKLNRMPTDSELESETVALEAPAGSMVVMEGRLWHQTGNNRTQSERRAAIFGFYTIPIYRTQENWFLSLNPSVHRYASDTLLTLLGYKAEGLGLVNGASPL